MRDCIGYFLKSWQPRKDLAAAALAGQSQSMARYGLTLEQAQTVEIARTTRLGSERKLGVMRFHVITCRNY